MSKQKIQRYLLDTSVLRKMIWGIDEEKTDINRTIGTGISFTSNYCVKELLVGVIKPLIALYFVLKEASDTESAIKNFSNVFSTRVPKFLMTAIFDLRESFNNEKVHDLYVLKMYIDFVYKLIYSKPNRGIIKEKHLCYIADLNLHPTEESYKSFFNKIKDLFKNKPSNICKIENFLEQNKNLSSKFLAEPLKRKENGFKEIQKAYKNLANINKCSLCSKIGDLIISMEDFKSILLTYDKSMKEITNVCLRSSILLENKSAIQYQQAIKKI
jgi:hypothetical protein